MIYVLFVIFMIYIIATLLMFRRRDKWWREYQERKNSYPDGEGMMIQPDKPWPRE